jgi:hypothetical protein
MIVLVHIPIISFSVPRISLAESPPDPISLYVWLLSGLVSHKLLHFHKQRKNPNNPS